MSGIMNRTLTSGGIALAMIGIFSCTEHSLTGVNNFSSEDLSADASRIATVSVSLGSGSIAVGDTTRAVVTLKDYAGGHGWKAGLYDDIRDGIAWLEKNGSAPKKP